MTPATMDADREHGKPRVILEENIAAAQAVMDALPKAGIDFTQVTLKLVNDAVGLFVDAADQLYASVQKKRQMVLGSKQNSMSYKIPADLETDVDAAIEDWRRGGEVHRL